MAFMLPPYLQQIDPIVSGTRKTTQSTRPQTLDTLLQIYGKSLAGVPEAMTGVGESNINRIFEEAVRANQEMARKDVAARGGDRGVAPVSSGVASQKFARAMMPLRQRMAEFSLEDAFRTAASRRESQQRGSELLFGAASTPISEGLSEETTWRRPEAAEINPNVPRVEYPSQGGGGGRGIGGRAGGLDSSDFWNKPFDPFGGWKDIGGMRGEYNRRGAAEYDERARREAEIWNKQFAEGRTSSPSGVETGLGSQNIWQAPTEPMSPDQPATGQDLGYWYDPGGTSSSYAVSTSDYLRDPTRFTNKAGLRKRAVGEQDWR